MNCLFAIHAPKDPHTAVYGHVAQRAADLEQHGHRVWILAPEDFPRLARHPRWRPLLYPCAVALWLLKHRRDIDLVVFHSYAGWLANLWPRRGLGARKWKSITQFHGLEPLYHRAARAEARRRGHPLRLRYRLVHGALIPLVLRISCHRSDRTLCLNRGELEYLVRHGWAPLERVSLIANTVSQDFFLERQHRPETHRLLFLGQWLEAKGVHYLVEAFALLARDFPALELWCVGTRIPPSQVLESFPTELRDRVRVVVEADRKAIADHLARSDIFVFPSLSEGSSMALLEAMASGLPIVATLVGAAPDLLEDSRDALFVPPGRSLLLAEALRRLLTDPSLRERLGQGAQAAARECSWEHRGDHFRLLLERTAAPAPGGRQGTAAGPERSLASPQEGRAAYESWHRSLAVDEQLNTPWHRMIRHHLETARDLAGRTILEVGCGRGGFACWLARHPARPHRIVAADFAATAVRKGMAYALRQQLAGVAWQVADIVRLPYPEGSFDTVFSCETVEHVIDPTDAVGELARVLKPGGHLYLTTPSYLNPSGLYRLYLRLRRRTFTEAGQPINHPLLLPWTVRKVKKAGLIVRRVDGVGHFLPLWPGRPALELTALDRARFLTRWSAVQSLIVAEKPASPEPLQPRGSYGPSARPDRDAR